MIDTLIIESIPECVHLATAGEIAISESALGKNVGFAFIHSNNPDGKLIPRDQLHNISIKLRGISKKNLVTKIEKELSKFDVKIIDTKKESLSKPILQDIQAFVQESPGNLEDLRKYSYKGANLGLGIVSSLISKTKNYSCNPKNYPELVNSYLESSAFVFEITNLIINNYKPKKIISFNGRFACAKAIFESASILEVPVQYHERGATVDKYEIFDKQPHNLPYIRNKTRLFWETSTLSLEDKVSTAKKYFESRRQGDGIGWISFVDSQTKGLVPSSTENRKIVYFSSSDDEYAAVEKKYLDSLRSLLFKDQRQAIEALIDWVSNQEKTNLIIRVHPHLMKKSPEDRKWWTSLNGNNVSLIPPESSIDSYALIDWSDLVVTYRSTTGIEATYWGKPSISVGPAHYSGFGCVYEPESIQDLFHLLGKPDLQQLNQETCFIYGFYRMSFGIPYRYYKPENLFRGKFLNKDLTLYPEWVDVSREFLKKLSKNSSN
jgi:hypothetical protein